MSVRPKCLALGLYVVLALGWTAPGWAINGQGSLIVFGAEHTPTHWDIGIGVPVGAEIHGVDPGEVGGSLPATLTIWVKSTFFGNTMLIANRIGLTNDYAFTYTAPAIAHGDNFDACSTTIVSYYEFGLNANNDYADDGTKNGSGISASGLRYVDDAVPLECEPVSLDASTWSGVKALFH